MNQAKPARIMLAARELLSVGLDFLNIPVITW
jgi:hypothetical protein